MRFLYVRPQVCALLVLMCVVHCRYVSAIVRMPSIFGDYMVLESREAYDIRPFINGWASPGESVTVVGPNHHQYPTTADENGEWEVQMNCCDAATNRTISVHGENNTVTANYVHCGQVYVISGQSNAAFPLKWAENGTQEMASALGKRQIRLFVVPRNPQGKPQTDFKGAKWVEASPDTVADFSAVGWMFARHVSDMYWGDLPFGLIMTTYGGTRVEAWSPPSVMTACQNITTTTSFSSSSLGTTTTSSVVRPTVRTLSDTDNGRDSTSGESSDSSEHVRPLSSSSSPPISSSSSISSSSNDASALWNGMVAPLTKYSIRGVVWFQGEHNVVENNKRDEYACLFGTMINAWRDAWRGIGDFPFVFAQLAPYFCYSPGPNGTQCDISAVRLAQSDSLPRVGLDTTGMAVTIDLGDPNSPHGSVHSRHKEEVARRLALQAMHANYAFQQGQPVINVAHPDQTPFPFNLTFSGPVPIENDVIATVVNEGAVATVGNESAASRLDGVVGNYDGAVSISIAFKYDSGLRLGDTLGCTLCCSKANDTLAVQFAPLLENNANDTDENGYGLGVRGGGLWHYCTDVKVYQGRLVGTCGGVETTSEKVTTPVVSRIRFAYSNFPQCALYNDAGLPASPFELGVTSTTRDPAAAAAAAAAASTAARAVAPFFLSPPPPPPSPSRTGEVSTAKLKSDPSNNGWLSTPPMGLNTWNSLHCNVDERKMRAFADALVDLGLADAGFEYVNSDDCWQVQRSPNGTINADPTRFPGGIRALTDYVHSKGLKFGLYTAAHQYTCQKRPGSYQHELLDAQTYCDWGIDYLKVDGCMGDHYPLANTSWINFRRGLDACAARGGPKIVLSVESCDDPNGCGSWIGKLANTWRTGGDIQATFGSVLNNLEAVNKMASRQGPTGGPLGGGRWNDADMLQVGNIGLSQREQISHYSLWVLVASPLLIGTDITLISKETLAILGNKEVAAIARDPRGAQGVPVGKRNLLGGECWARPLVRGFAVIFLNRGDTQAVTVTCQWTDVGLDAGTPATVRDLWAGKTVATGQKDSYSATVPPHGVLFATLMPE